MKYLIIPDIHGDEARYKNLIYLIDDVDFAIFIADYWDSFDKTFAEQLKCFNDIIRLKKRWPKKIILLLGNHDVHYLMDTVIYSGFQDKYAAAIKLAMEENLYLMQSAFLSEGMLFTHAGLSQTFLRYLNKQNDLPMDEFLNSLPLEKLHSMVNKQGYSPENCISFIRPEALKRDIYLDDVIKKQIVGHTEAGYMRVSDNLIIVDSRQELLLECN